MSKKPQAKSEPIKLVVPIKRGDNKVTEVTLREPKAGELRGLSLSELIKADVDSIIALTPRISTPTLTTQELQDMSAQDIAQIAGAVIVFLLG